MTAAPDPHSSTADPTEALSHEDGQLIVNGLFALEYWEWATEFNLPRRNGQVFLPEDDRSCWQRATIGVDEEVAVEQIRIIRELRERLHAQVGT
jgi:hypothetical protein